MSAHVAELRLIFETSMTDAQLQAFIDAAAVIVGPDGCDLASKGLSSATIDEIQKWLSAHLATVNDPRVVRFRSSGHSTEFESEVGLGLDASKYGQQVRILDKSGCIAKLGDPDRKGPLRFKIGAAYQLEESAGIDERAL